MEEVAAVEVAAVVGLAPLLEVGWAATWVDGSVACSTRLHLQKQPGLLQAA